MRIVIEMTATELAHTLDALDAVADIIERESDELVAAIIMRDVVDKIYRAVKELE